jgi:thiamine biosynthesis lipoprotein
MNGRIFRFLALVTVGIFVGCAKPVPPQTGFALGTVCTVNLYGKGSPELYRDIFNRLQEIEDRMSANQAGTELDHINVRAGIEPVQVHEDVFAVIERSLMIAEISEGAFDPTVGPLVKLWGIGADNPRLPAREEIDAVLPLINWRDVRIDKEERSVFLTRPGMALDLGAIAKGYAADEAARIIRTARIRRGIIDLGGNILALGEKEDRSPWRVGIQNPSGLRGSYIGVMNIRNKTMVTSGIYERYFELDGVRYHHILSTRDGYPAGNGLLSVTIIAERSMDADGLSTAVFALGYERGKVLAESLDGVEVLFIFDDKSIRGSAGALRDFTVTDPEYTLAD